MIKKLIIFFIGTCIGSSQLMGQDNTNNQDNPKIDKITKTIKETIENTYFEKGKLESKIKNLEKQKRELANNVEKSDEERKEIERKNREYSQIITPLISEIENTINHILSSATDKTSLETINSIINISNYLSILEEKDNQLRNKILKLEKYKEEFQIIHNANLLLNRLYNKENNSKIIESLRNLNLSGERNTEKIKTLDLLEKYCKMNNKIAALFVKVDGLTNNSDKESQLYKGTYHKYTREYPFLYQELQNKKGNLKYKSKIKEVVCE